MRQMLRPGAGGSYWQQQGRGCEAASGNRGRRRAAARIVKLRLLVLLFAVVAVGAAQGSGGAPSPTAYSLVAVQAQEVAVTIRFVNAFNAHNLGQALATFTPSAIGSDCDYGRVQAVSFRGKRQIRAWLRGRFADGDYLGVARISNANPSEPSGVVGVEWAIRKSKTLRRLGFPNGIVPQLSAKVVFTSKLLPRISVFANGPGGGDPKLCRAR
jgi:hypothetical protein